MKKLLIILIAIIVISSFLAGCGESAIETETVTKTETATETAEPITLVFQSMDPEDSAWGRVLIPWFAELEEVSGGRVKVEAHWNGELVPMPEIYDAVVKGTLDFAQHLTSMPAGRFPMDEIGSFTSYDVTCHRLGRVFWELHEMFPEMGEPYNDTKLIWVGATFPNPLCTTEKYGPVTTLEDNQGLKEGAYGEWMAKRGTALGRTPVSLQPAETYSAFEKGVADGMQCSIFLLKSAKFGEVLPYITLMNGTIGAWTLVMNLDTWNSLPADVQQYIDNSGEELVDAMDIECLRALKVAKETYPAEFGSEFIEISEGEFARWAEADKAVFDEFIASLEAQGLPGTELVEEFQRLEEKYAAEEYALK